jgi:glutamyl-tRNA reductase
MDVQVFDCAHPIVPVIVSDQNAGEQADHDSADPGRGGVAPTIRRLQRAWAAPKEAELERLLQKLPQMSERARGEIRDALDRLVDKLAHPVLECLHEESRDGEPAVLLEAIVTLFQLKE